VTLRALRFRGSQALCAGLVVAACAIAGLSAPVAAQAVPRTPAKSAQTGSGYFVTFVALWCNSYTDIFANRARNDIVESLRDLGPDTQYGTSGALINPIYEKKPPQDRCHPITGWEFTLGRGILERADNGVWGSMSRVTSPFPTSIVTACKRQPASAASRAMSDANSARSGHTTALR
jgi:hypothetical protein